MRSGREGGSLHGERVRCCRDRRGDGRRALDLAIRAFARIHKEHPDTRLVRFFEELQDTARIARPVADELSHGFTAGADAEYEEQILPLAAEHLDGCRRVLDVGAGEGQVARLAAGTTRITTSSGTPPLRAVDISARASCR